MRLRLRNSVILETKMPKITSKNTLAEYCLCFLMRKIEECISTLIMANIIPDDTLEELRETANQKNMLNGTGIPFGTHGITKKK